MDGQIVEDLWTTAINVMELQQGALLLQPGHTRSRLEASLDRMIRDAFADRILPFDLEAAQAAARLFAARRRRGVTVEIRDTQIAGIAVAQGAAVATRNTRHFQDLDLEVLNPWEA